MFTRLALAACLATAFAFGAWADDDDKIMGVYEGAFSGKDFAGKTIRAEVIGRSKIQWQINLFTGADGKEEKSQMEGRLKDGTAEVAGHTPLGELTGVIKAEEFTGKIKGEGKSGEFALKRVIVTPPTLGKEPPADAISLLNGKNMAENWVRTVEQWCLQDDGSMEVCESNLRTRQEFGDAEWHIEFRTPYKPNARDQERGNSGCYFMGRYEVQVLDSFGEEPRDNWCGGIYKKAKPLLGASLPPLTWQTYDVTMIAPKFDASGKKISDAEITVYLNGKLIHDHVKLDSPTPGGVSDQDGPTGPLLLQNHDNPVRYRNIWVRPLK